MIIIEKTLEQLHPKIKKSLYYTNINYREDLEQELKIKIIEAFYNNIFEEPIGFWDFIDNTTQLNNLDN